MENNIYKWTAG